MRILSLFNTLAVTLLCCNTIAYADQAELTYASALANTIVYVDQHQAEVWPGFHVSNTPTVIYFTDTAHSYVFNFTPKNPDWQKLIIANQFIYELDHDEYNLKDDQLDFNYMVDGQGAYIVQPFSNVATKNQTHDLIALVHERFHFYQFYESKFINYVNYSTHPYAAINNSENIELTYLSLIAIKEYLLSQNEDALKDYVAINQYRQQLLDTESLAYESAKEMLEGTAAYVGFRSANLNDNDYVQDILTDETYTASCTTLADKDKIASCVEHNRFYLIGPAVGFALDKLSPAWKEQVEQSGITPDTILQNYYSLSASEISQRVKAFAAQHPLPGTR